jgi:hypothetical protein
LLFPFWVCGVSTAATIVVPSDAPSIASAVSIASTGDTVLVRPGTYLEEGIRIDEPISILGDGYRDEVVIDGGIPPIPPDTTSIFICRAEDVVFANLRLVDGGSLWDGGSVLLTGSASIRNCVLERSGTEGSGGAIFCAPGSRLDVEDAVFGRSFTQYGHGGAIFGEDASIRCVASTFELCSADNGGAIAATRSQVLIENCIFRENYAGGEFRSSWLGGAVYLNECDYTIQDCHFFGNVASNPFNGYGSGGAAWLGGGVGSITNCLFLQNRAAAAGGAVRMRGQGVIQNCTFVGNGDADPTFGILGGHVAVYGNPAIRANIFADATDGAGFACGSGAGPQLECNDFWNSPDPDFPTFPGCAFFSQGNDSQGDNFSADPLFCDSAAEDFHLRAASHCAPGNSPGGCGLVGAFGVACPANSVEEVTWGRIKARYAH